MENIATRSSRTLTLFERRVRAGLINQLGALKGGSILLTDPEGSTLLGEPDHSPIMLEVFSGEFYRSLALRGSVGIAESFMNRQWVSNDLVQLMRLLIANRDALDAMETGLARAGGLVMKWIHKMKPNSIRGARRNIAEHYDLGNELFERMLDKRMMYSSALFTRDDLTLEAAQEAKLARIASMLELGPDDHLLEIGTGWGGLAEYMAAHTGCRVTTTTISQEQHDAARQRVAAAGLADRVEVLLKDYRHLKGRYDKLVSVEMIEAIGHKNLANYFATCRARLKPGGLFLLQAITIEDHRYLRARDSVDFIKHYIFPGSFIPGLSLLIDQAATHRLRTKDLKELGMSYALTLNHWRQRFLEHEDWALASGYDETFVRMWVYYLCYCEAGFLEQSISDYQILLVNTESVAEKQKLVSDTGVAS